MALLDNQHLNNLLTKEECKKILEQSAITSEVVDFQIIKVEGGVEGFLGEHLKLTITTAKDSQAYFLKSLPIFNLRKRKFLERAGIFKKEVDLYGLLEQFSGEWKPRCYLARNDLIVLEDLSLKGFQTAPDRFEFNQAHVKLVLEVLASLHGSSMNFEVKSGESIAEKYKNCLFEVSALRDNTWFVTGLKCLVSVAAEATKYSYALQTEEARGGFFEKLLEVTDHVQTQDFSSNKAICHRDIWNKNLMFYPNSENPEKCVLIDFQIAGYLPPGTDLMMALVMLQRRADREMHFEENLQLYYAKLGAHLTHLKLTKVQLKSQCTYFHRLALVLKGIFLTMTHLPPGEMNKIHADEAEYHRFICENRAPIVLKYLRQDKCLRDLMVETVEELFELTLL